MEFVIILIILMILGACIGSFINVLIYRVIHEQDWVSDRSRCEYCHKKIAWYDNIPLLSFVWLGGKCRRCHKAISLLHPLVELLTASLFVWWYVVGFVFFRLTQHPFAVLQPMFWLIVGILLLIIFVADLVYLIIPDFAVLGLLGLTFLYRGYLVLSGIMRWQDLALGFMSLGVLVLAFFALWWLTKGKGFGFGDVKLAAPLALLLGWPKIVVGVFFAFILGASLGIILVILGKKRFGQTLPFGPFLVSGALVALLFGDQIWNWYLGFMG